MSRADRLIEAKLRQTAKPKPKKKPQDAKGGAEAPPPPPTLANVLSGAPPSGWPGYSRAPVSTIGRSMWFSDTTPGKTTPRLRRRAR